MLVEFYVVPIQSRGKQSGGLQSGGLQSVQPIWEACTHSLVGGHSLGGYSLGDYSLGGYSRCNGFWEACKYSPVEGYSFLLLSYGIALYRAKVLS